jgi:hypothetical protein
VCVCNNNDRRTRKKVNKIKEIRSDDDRAGYVVGENTGEAKVATDHRVGSPERDK